MGTTATVSEHGRDRVRLETFTGLRGDQFGRLLNAARKRGDEGRDWGHPRQLPLAEWVRLVTVYYRTNLTVRQLAPLFGASPATVCRVVQGLGPLLALELARGPQGAVERLWIVDGTRRTPTATAASPSVSRVSGRCIPGLRLPVRARRVVSASRSPHGAHKQMDVGRIPFRTRRIRHGRSA
ncbi:helix-turn-helix domain-containing protein [Streptomyces sp. WG4]|uniref:helix-turn-helix domain-containing protein n=1 Tax=Streptomyces sp. WG4 TaxID=3417649 RepID=UPI003CE8CFCE